MAKETLTVRVEPETRDALDALAAALDRDRSYLINEALNAYVDVHKWQIDQIRTGLREAGAGKFVSDRKMKNLLDKLRRR